MDYSKDVPEAPPPKDDFTPARGTSFFARIRSFDIACPRCDAVHRLTRNHPRAAWDPATSTFNCDNCSLTLVIGVLAWHPPPGIRRVPEDHLPLNLHQALELRALAKAVLRPERAQSSDEVRKSLGNKVFVKSAGHLSGNQPRLRAFSANRLAPVGCSCYVELKRDPECAIHGELTELRGRGSGRDRWKEKDKDTTPASASARGKSPRP